MLALFFVMAWTGGVAQAGSTLPPLFRAETIAVSTSSQSSVYPLVPDGPLAPAVNLALVDLVETAFTTGLNAEALRAVVEGGDPRTAWVLADLLRLLSA